MAEQNSKLDPFKPAQPHIPGVPQPSDETGAAPNSILAFLVQPAVLLGACGVLAFLIGGSLWLHSRFSSKPEADSAAAKSSWAASAPAFAPVQIPVGPGVIGTTDEIAKIWSAKRFDYTDPDTGLTIPAMVVHLPRGGYWGFSLREPFGGCRMEYVTDLKKLQDIYNFKSDHPMIADPCDYSVFDLLKYGPTTDDTIVRGAIVHGTALRPPIAIEIKIQGNKVVAARRE